MAVREIVEIGHPALRTRAREVEPAEVGSAAIEGLIEDLIETKRAADGAGIAANQVGVPIRVAIAEVEGQNPRYPYKPPIPLTVMINPVIEPLAGEEALITEGCLSVPGLRGTLLRRMEIRVTYLDRHGEEQSEVRRGLTAGTFQHEVDHLDGVLFVDRADPRSLTTWEEYERNQREEAERRMRDLAERFGS
jgi:peptide deformylase